ncbi:MAG TPA: Rap1a/Tai family immunity protein [Phenylobacterium sp.]|jgi:hypothetical protein
MHWLVILSLITGTTPPPATLPGFIDAAKLIELCGAELDAGPGRAICVGYVVGAVDQLMAQQSQLEEARRTICPPSGMTVEDAVSAVVKYGRFGSTATNIGASGFVRFAMEETFPCASPAKSR